MIEINGVMVQIPTIYFGIGCVLGLIAVAIAAARGKFEVFRDSTTATAISGVFVFLGVAMTWGILAVTYPIGWACRRKRGG